MPYKRFDELDPIKKQSIIDKSIEAFAENSFKTASLNGISRKAGISAGALYYYFEDKKDLFYTILDYVSDEVWQYIGDMEDNFKTIGYWEGIAEVVERRVMFSLENPLYMKLFHRVLLSDDGIEIDGRYRLLAAFEQIFDFGYTNGYIRNDLPRSLLFDLHFNMTLTINQWTLKKLMDDSEEAADLEALCVLSSKAVEMIRLALEPKERRQ